MKTKILITILFAFLFSLHQARAQKKMVIDQDTVVVITPKNLSTINGMLEERVWLKKEVSLKDSLLIVDSLALNNKDSLIVGYQRREAKKEEYYIEQAKSLKDSLKKEKTKRTFFSAAGGLLVGLLIGLLL